MCLTYVQLQNLQRKFLELANFTARKRLLKNGLQITLLRLVSSPSLIGNLGPKRVPNNLHKTKVLSGISDIGQHPEEWSLICRQEICVCLSILRFNRNPRSARDNGTGSGFCGAPVPRGPVTTDFAPGKVSGDTGEDVPGTSLHVTTTFRTPSPSARYLSSKNTPAPALIRSVAEQMKLVIGFGTNFDVIISVNL